MPLVQKFDYQLLYIYSISHDLRWYIIFIQQVVSFLSPSLGNLIRVWAPPVTLIVVPEERWAAVGFQKIDELFHLICCSC